MAEGFGVGASDSFTEAAPTRERTKSGSVAPDILGSGADGTGFPTRHDLMYGMDVKAKPAGFFKSAKKSYPMYPLREEKIKWDDYGEMVNFDDFKFAENAMPGFGTGGDDSAGLKDAENAGRISSRCFRISFRMCVCV